MAFGLSMRRGRRLLAEQVYAGTRSNAGSGNPVRASEEENAVVSNHISPYAQSRIVLIADVSNVVREGPGGKLSRLRVMVRQLDELGIASVLIADASLRHRIDDREGYEKLLEEGSVRQAPAGFAADLFINRAAMEVSARGLKPYLLSNDIALSKSGHFIGTIKFMFIQLLSDELLITQPAIETLRQPVQEAAQ